MLSNLLAVVSKDENIALLTSVLIASDFRSSESTNVKVSLNEGHNFHVHGDAATAIDTNKATGGTAARGGAMYNRRSSLIDDADLDCAAVTNE